MKEDVKQTEKMLTYPKSFIKVTIVTLCCLALTALLSSSATADPRQPELVIVPQHSPQAIVIQPPPQPYRRGLRPPPRGKVWVEVMGRWNLVPRPPGNGPYIWVNGRWVPDTASHPSDAEWVPGHWSRRGWVPGHWRAVSPAPHSDVRWVPGHWNGNVWVPGHWSGHHPQKKRWVPGHHGPRGWTPGHWR